ncbi:hypothetical protein CHARACLAT_025475 [Characodon lateralis]|uniref:Uncharacterized protein n=1 Tax=Characodon lateralis TaxID=208331 RepID=A0ABU7CVC0_9TELE|nr:hypothetical protein [Characodon lateralis]
MLFRFWTNIESVRMTCEQQKQRGAAGRGEQEILFAVKWVIDGRATRCCCCLFFLVSSVIQPTVEGAAGEFVSTATGSRSKNRLTVCVRLGAELCRIICVG